MNLFPTKIAAVVATLALMGAGCAVTQPGANGSSDSTKESGVLVPEAASVVLIKDCKATPKIYQAKEGSSVSFKNQDAVARTLFLDSKTYTVAGNSELKVTARFSLPAPTTINYLCDEKSNGDAIFVTP